MPEKINITYETLFDILRHEKNTGELQNLNKFFYDDVVSYLKAKQDILNNTEGGFSETEKEKTLAQLQNIKKILKEIYEKREKKIIDIALNKAKTGSDIVDLSSLLPQERKFFDIMVKLFSNNRNEVLNKIINGQQPTLNEVIKPKKEEKDNTEEEQITKKKIKFIHPVPKFLGKDLETYGPYNSDEIAELPKELADILIRKGRAEEIRQ